MTECVECGNDNGVTWSNMGMLCLQCQARRNRELGEEIRNGRVLTQAVDPDGPPLRCCVIACSRDATMVVRLWHTGRELLVTTCDDHTDTLAEIITELRTGTAGIGDQLPD
jgi:hypothetical protein